jgi:hypothetical protein
VPAVANHGDGTYTGTSASNANVSLMVSGDSVTASVANDPCGGSASRQAAIDPNQHTFSSADLSFRIAGRFDAPNQGSGSYQFMGCLSVDFTVTREQPPAPEPPPPEQPPGITKTETVVREDARFAIFTFTLSNPLLSPYAVEVQTRDGTGRRGAKAGKDYLPVRGTVVFPPGETQKQIYVPIKEDHKDEKKREIFYVFSPQDGETTGGIWDNDVDPLSGCKCEEARLLRPKKLKPEAWLFAPACTTGTPPPGQSQPAQSVPCQFATVRIPLRYFVRCTPPAQPPGCSAELLHDEDFFEASWNASGVNDLHVLPRRHTCSAKCNEKEEQEVWFTYTGWVTDDWPTEGNLRFRWVLRCEDKEQKVTVRARVTFPRVPTTVPDAVQGQVDLDYEFGM